MSEKIDELRAYFDRFEAEELFMTVAARLLKQGARSMSGPVGKQTCVYRGEHGMKCAVGLVIPDELYDPDFEGSTADELLGWDHKHRGLLGDLQQVHDWGNPDNWRSRLTHLAVKNGFDPNKVGTDYADE